MRLLVLVCTISWAFATQASAATAEPRDLYCQGKHDGKATDSSITRKYDQGVGFNPAQFISQRYTTGPSVHADDERERDKFRTEKLKTFIKERGAAVLDVPAVLEAFDRTGWTGLHSRNTVLSTVVRVYEERGEVDCRTGSYSYSVEFLMPKNPLQVLSYPLRAPFEDAVGKALGQAFSAGDVFHIGEIIERIRQTLAANESVQREAAKTETSLRLLNPRFRELFPTGVLNSHFGVGEYRLSSEMAYVIEQVLRRFLRRPETETDSFDLIVRGYTDASPVRELIYEGMCDISGRANVITELPANRNAKTISTITSNSQLSIARGCEGALFAKSLIPIARHIRVFYSGGDAIAGAPQDIYRGIELRLERRNGDGR
jgi:hypothetical protein